jgi:prevent-host-death family protein
MAEVTTAEAKKHLSDLLKRAQAGEIITITRYGKAVATLNPPKHAAPDMRAFRERHGRVRGSGVDELLRMREAERY